MNLAHYHTFALPARARQSVRLTSLSGISQMIRLVSRGEPILILGDGSNSVFLEDVSTRVFAVRFQGISLIHENQDSAVFRVRAGTAWDRWVAFATARGLWGVENLAGIPGRVGASPIQNIGAYGMEIGETVEWVEGINLCTGENFRYNRAQCAFGYRDSLFKSFLPHQQLITAVVMKLSKIPQPRLDYPDLRALRESARQTLTPDKIAQTIRAVREQKLPDVKKVGNAGSFFKNPMVANATAEALKIDHPLLPIYPTSAGNTKLSAAWLIEHAGLKGYRIGDVGVSAQHALVLVHYRRNRRSERERLQTLADLRKLIGLVLERVQTKFNIRLEVEANLYGAPAEIQKQ